MLKGQFIFKDKGFSKYTYFLLINTLQEQLVYVFIALIYIPLYRKYSFKFLGIIRGMGGMPNDYTWSQEGGGVSGVGQHMIMRYLNSPLFKLQELTNIFLI